jgi:hypothetical protein
MGTTKRKMEREHYQRRYRAASSAVACSVGAGIESVRWRAPRRPRPSGRAATYKKAPAAAIGLRPLGGSSTRSRHRSLISGTTATPTHRLYFW